MLAVSKTKGLTFSTWSALRALPLTQEYLSSPQFLNSTSADCGQYEIVWGWQLKRGKKVLGSGYEVDGAECLRKAVALGWPKPNVVFFDKYKQIHTPLPEDAEAIRQTVEALKSLADTAL